MPCPFNLAGEAPLLFCCNSRSLSAQKLGSVVHKARKLFVVFIRDLKVYFLRGDFFSENSLGSGLGFWHIC